MWLEEQTSIEAQPADVYGFFEAIECHYEGWHDAHVEYRWEDDDGLSIGNRAVFAEEIGGNQQTATVEVTGLERDRFIQFSARGWLSRIVFPQFTFGFESAPVGCVYTHRIRVRPGRIVGILAPNLIDRVETHMQEEARNLKAIMEVPD